MLKPGWAGLLGLSEAVYIRSELQRSGALRRLWGFGKDVQLAGIARRAYPEDPREAVKYIHEQEPVEKQPPKRAAKPENPQNGNRRGTTIRLGKRPKPRAAAARSGSIKAKVKPKIYKGTNAKAKIHKTAKAKPKIHKPAKPIKTKAKMKSRERPNQLKRRAEQRGRQAASRKRK